MAGTEIDELSLKISVQGATPTQTKNINAFAQSLEKLDKALPTSLIQKLDKLSKLSISMSSIQQAQNLGGKTSKESVILFFANISVNFIIYRLNFFIHIIIKSYI